MPLVNALNLEAQFFLELKIQFYKEIDVLFIRPLTCFMETHSQAGSAGSDIWKSAAGDR